MKCTFLAVCFLILFTIPQSECNAQDPFAQVVKVEQLEFVNPFRPGLSDVGNLTICLYNPTDSLLFFNMVALCPFGSPDYWAIENLPVPPFPDTLYLNVWVDLDPCGQYPDGLPFEFFQWNQHLTDEVMVSPPPFSFPDSYFSTMMIGEYDVLSNPREHLLPTAIEGTVFLPLEPLLWDPIIPYTYKERGCEIPNIDLDNSEHPAEPGYAGDKNACVPAAAANSFMWLKDQHPEIADIIEAKYGDDSTTHRQVLRALSGAMNRADCAGVAIRPFIKGKQTFVDNCMFPMSVKFQNVFFDHDLLSDNSLYGHYADNQNTTSQTIDMNWVLQELCDGEDVEADFDCYYVDPATGDVYDGWAHCITISGAYNVSGNWGFSFKDDAEQDEEGGMEHSFTWLRNDPTPGISGNLVLDKFSGDTLSLILVDTAGMPVDTIDVIERCFLGDVVSESYDATVSFDTIPCPTTLNLANDTLCSGIYQASDTICIENIHIKTGQDVIITAPNVKIDEVSTVARGSTVKIDTTGCMNP